MVDRIRYFSQNEYTRILNKHNARSRNLTQCQCEKILMGCSASYQQAKNGAYVYLHHGEHLTMYQRGSQDEYDQLLDNFGGRNKKPKDCVKYLESLHFSYGQAKTAVYKYRVSRKLIRKLG